MVSLTLHHARQGQKRGFRLFVAAAQFALTLAGAVAIIALYSRVYLHTHNILELPPEYRLHLMENLACLCAVLLYALRAHGNLDRKLAETGFMAILTHGVLAFLILAGRWPFSRPVLMSNFAISAALGLAVVLLKHRISGPRVAVVRPLATDVILSRHFGEVITSPDADLSGYDVILVSLTDSVSAEWARALSRAMLSGSQVRHVGQYVEEVRGAVSLQHFELDQLTNLRFVSYRSLKRLLDIASVIFVLPVVLPLVGVAALAILVTMGWPVFFIQERIGLAGQPFRMWKLRTMLRAKAGEADRAAVPGDRRVTHVGALLRRFRIDELPQMWNVLRGEMSLIGPRPEAVAFHDAYLREVPEYAYRNLVRPGITGWAQVSTPPSANADEARRKLSYDLYYVKRMSLFLDLQIALRTVWTVTHGAGVR